MIIADFGRDCKTLPACVPGVSLRTVRWGGTLLPQSGNRAGDGMACSGGDRRQRRKQGAKAGAAASRMQGESRRRRWEPQPVFVSEEKASCTSVRTEPLHFPIRMRFRWMVRNTSSSSERVLSQVFLTYSAMQQAHL